MSGPFALYVHLPWCRRVCPYCDFNVYASTRIRADEEARTLSRALALAAAGPPWGGRRIATVYFGGGTPSLLPPATFGAVLETAGRLFGLEDGAEVTLEANPGTVTRASLEGYRRAGVNRLSLGAQSFDASVLATLGRDHAPEDTAAAVEAAAGAGFENVSLDLIFAVPGQTLEQWETDVSRAVSLGPRHLSTYALTFEPRTPFHVWRASGRLVPVDEDVEAAMLEHGSRLLPALGYERYEISSWARPGFASRHNQRYWDGSDYLGIGPGAHSHSAWPSPGRRWVTERRPESYRAAIDAGGSGLAEEERLSEHQARADFVVTGLRRLIGVDGRDFTRRFGQPLDAAFPHLPDLVREGLVEHAGDRLRLTARGLTFADTVSATFV